MKRVLSFALLIGCLGSCASRGPRVLAPEEMARYGLTGVIYDAPICPTKLVGNALRVNGKCELVTCEPRAGRLECLATPEP